MSTLTKEKLPSECPNQIKTDVTETLVIRDKVCSLAHNTDVNRDRLHHFGCCADSVVKNGGSRKANIRNFSLYLNPTIEDEDDKDFSTSPKEDFNPLADVKLRNVDKAYDQGPGEDADLSEDEDFRGNGDDQEFHSLDGDLENSFFSPDGIPFSPPVHNSRLLRREKSKSKKTSTKECRRSTSMEKLKKTPINVIKERYSESTSLFGGLAGVDSDADLDKELSREGKEKRKKEREEKQKVLTKSRQSDIFNKRHSDDISAVGGGTAPMDIQTPVVKLEGSGRYLALAGGVNRSSVCTVSVPMSVPVDRAERRPTSNYKSECPQERLKFYRTFSALINMGSHGKKQKEQKEKEKSSLLAQRQKSSEEKWYMKYIWVGLQAILSGITVSEQEQIVQEKREQVEGILQEILNFRVQFEGGELHTEGGTNPYLSEQKKGCNSSCSIDTEASALCIEETYQSMYLTHDIIEQQQEAVIQVKKILDKLDQCEQLYPTSSAFAQEHPLYIDNAFILRTEALYLWLNITKDLCEKLKVLEQVLNIQSVSGANWPSIDFDRGSRQRELGQISSQSIPEIDSEEEDSDENEENEAEPANDSEVETSSRDKKVSFAVSSDQSQVDGARLSHGAKSPVNIGSPPDTSTPLKNSFFNTSLSRASSETSIDELQSKASIYRNFVDKGLKKVGLNKMLIRLRDIVYRSLHRARESLEQPHSDAQSPETVCKSPSEDIYAAHSTSLDLLDKAKQTVQVTGHPPEQYKAYRNEIIDIGLPSYRPTYIFLLQVLLDVIHEAMKIRLEQLQNPIGEPSFLSTRQLIIECKDVLAKAVLVKQDYQWMVQAVLEDSEANAENSPLDLEQFDDDMSSMFKMYFQYLQSWLYHLQNLPEASRSLKNPLEEEWSFTKKICPHIIGGEIEAGKRFSTMAISLLNSICDFLDTGIDEHTTKLQDWTTNELSGPEDGESEDDDTSSVYNKSRNTHKIAFQKTCRNFKNLFHEARERASKALGFAKLLRKDLEIAADFNIAVTTVELLQKLKETNHINVIAPLSAGYMMFIPRKIADHRSQIIQLLNVTCGREDMSSLPADIKEEGYLLMVRCGGGVDNRPECPLWTGSSIKVEPTAETAIALSHIQVESLLLVVTNSSYLSSQRKEFERQLDQTVELVNEQTSCHRVIAESLIELKETAISLQEKVADSITAVKKHLNYDLDMEESEKIHILKLYRETMLQAFNFGFEYMKEVTRLVSGEARLKLGRGLMQFSKDWMKFVSEKCERGRGMRPRWANQGLDFLLLAVEPKVLALLSEQEYQNLQEIINECISHLIGNAEKSHILNTTTGVMHTVGSENSLRTSSYNRNMSWPAHGYDGKISRSQSTKSMQETPSTPHSAPAGRMKKRSSDGGMEVDLHDGEDGGIVIDVHRRSRGDSLTNQNVFSYKPTTRIEQSIMKLERERNAKLQEGRVIGRVTSRKREINYHINTRKVNFHWQKGNKIGEGQFGKVYSAVNMVTGELMAMKEMKFPSADMQYHFKEIIDEIRIFEGINHPNLVKYYGVEVHRSEMLVFMEYCDRGTIDEVSRVGLTEDLIRLYTRELLLAVQVIHEHSIVHRDIKGANIFLTSNGCLKLGDFGCSVKLQNHTTMAGEVNKLVGTMAFMAPEVITRSDREGHGRGADIWSIGCVVIEMASGKRPWHELESNFQIMYKLGMGETPAIPENLGDEGKNFLSHCLEIEPGNRWSASQLRDHPFAKIHDPEGGEYMA